MENKEEHKPGSPVCLAVGRVITVLKNKNVVGGTGFIIDHPYVAKELLFITCEHVVRHDCLSATVQFYDAHGDPFVKMELDVGRATASKRHWSTEPDGAPNPHRLDYHALPILGPIIEPPSGWTRLFGSAKYMEIQTKEAWRKFLSIRPLVFSHDFPAAGSRVTIYACAGKKGERLVTGCNISDVKVYDVCCYTETTFCPGSSGSPLVDEKNQVVAMLQGHTGFGKPGSAHFQPCSRHILAIHLVSHIITGESPLIRAMESMHEKMRRPDIPVAINTLASSIVTPPPIEPPISLASREGVTVESASTILPPTDTNTRKFARLWEKKEVEQKRVSLLPDT